jgi:hypothetical protein
MFKLSFAAAGFLIAGAGFALAGDAVPATGLTQAPVLKPVTDVQSKAVEVMPFEPASSQNHNPYEVNCTRSKAKDETVYYTN